MNERVLSKRYFVYPQLPLFVLPFSIMCMVAVIICMTVPQSYDNDEMLVLISLIVLGLLVLICDIGIICIMWAKIGIDEKGVTKYLFGKKIKFFGWSEICEIKGLNNDKAYWIVFCNKPIADEKLYFCNRKSYTIPIHRRQEVVDAIMEYYPNDKKESCKE